MSQKRGFQEFEHTADWGIHVWAEDFTSLLCMAAEGMYYLLDVNLEGGVEVPVTISIPASESRESLLVDFLNELLYLLERDKLIVVECDLEISNEMLVGELSGRKMISQVKEIKAATFHALEVVGTSRGFEASIVFDV